MPTQEEAMTQMTPEMGREARIISFGAVLLSIAVPFSMGVLVGFCFRDLFL